VFWLDNASSNSSVRRRQQQLGRELRRMYQHVASESVPEELLTLLERIDASQDLEQTSDRSHSRKQN